jgi:uncharacterized repeat protein (TIGR01451 family)
VSSSTGVHYKTLSSYQNLLTILAVSLLTLCLAPVGLAQTYTITDLGTLGGSFSQGNGINASGQVTGFSYLTGDAAYHAFLYSAGTMADLGTFGGSYSEGRSINSSGQVTGYSYLADDNEYHAFLYSGGTTNDLGTLGGFATDGRGINDSGQVTGEVLTAPVGFPHAFLYSAGIMTDIGTPGIKSIGNGINTSGQITGQNGGDAFLYGGGTMTDIGSLAGFGSVGNGINASGQVTGYSVTADTRFYHAFLYSGGIWTDLGALGGGFSVGNGINASGQVTGYSSLIQGGASRAFLYAPATGMVDLNTLLPNGSGWTLELATGINDAGQVTGEGIINGANHAFLMSPVTSTADLAIRVSGAPKVKSGFNLNYAIAVQNKGPQNANNVTVNDAWSSGFYGDQATYPINITCNFIHETGISCNLGTIAAGGGVSISVMGHVTASVGGSLSNTGTVRGNVSDLNTANNTSTLVTSVTR